MTDPLTKRLFDLTHPNIASLLDGDDPLDVALSFTALTPEMVATLDFDTVQQMRALLARTTPAAVDTISTIMRER